MAEFRIRARIDATGAVTGGRQVEGALNRTGTAADRMRRSLSRAFAVLGGGAALGLAIRRIATFSQAMSTVQAVTSATEDQFMRLRDEAERLGAETRFSATQAAEGMLFLARAGFDTEQVLATIGGTLQLAQAGALGLGSAADIASNVLKGFRLEVDQTQRVVDVLALAANSSNTSVQQLGDALKFVAPVAASLNVSLEETTAAIGNLSDAGLQGSLAGTGLRRVLAELESPAKKTADILASLGVRADEVRVSQVGLTAAIERLTRAGIDAGQALEIFGDRGGPAFEILRSSVPDVQRMTESLRNAEGTAARVAEIMDDNLNGALLRVASAYESVILALGRGGAEARLTQGFEGLADALRTVARNMELSIEIAGRLFAVFAVAKILALSRGFVRLSGAIAGATAAMRVLLRAFIVPALIVEGILLIVDSWDAVQRSINRLNWDTVVVGAADAVSGILKAFANLPFRLLGVFRAIFNIVVRTFDAITKYIGDAVGEAVQNAFGAVTRGELQERLRAVTREIELLERRSQGQQSPDDLLLTGERLTRLSLDRNDLQRRLEELERPTITVGRSLGETLGNAVTEELGKAFSTQNRVFSSGPDIAGLLLPPDRVAAARKNLGAIGNDLGDSLLDALRQRLALFRSRESIPEPTLEAFGGAGPSIRTGPAGPTAPARPRLSTEEADQLRELQDRLNPVGAALRAVADARDLLSKAQRVGAIDDAQAGDLARRLGEAYRDQLDPLGAIQREIAREISLRGVAIGQREVEIDLYQAEASLKEQGVALSAAEREELRALFRTRQQVGRQLQLEQAAYRQLRDPLDDYLERMRAIEAVLAQHPELAGAAARAQEELRLKFLDTQNTIEAGLERAFIRYGQTATDVASQIESTTTNAFRGMEDSLVNFVRTGKLSFGDLASSILADLARIAIRASLTPIFNSLFGGLFGGLSGAAPPASIGFGVVGAARGGLIQGPGTGTSDSILTGVPAGSFVVNAAATRQYQQVLDLISGAPSFNTGGLVPVRVSNGEYLIGPDAAARNLDLLHAINSAPRFQAGGPVEPARFAGAPASSPARSGSRDVVLNVTVNGAEGEPQVRAEHRETTPDGDDIYDVVIDIVGRGIDEGDLDPQLDRRFGARLTLQ